jgi:hypothetical protein
MAANSAKEESLDSLFQAFSDLYSKDELKQELRDAGLNPDSLSSTGMSFVEKLQARNRREITRKSLEEKVATAKKKLAEILPVLQVNHKEYLAQLLYGRGSKLAVNFNKLNELTDKDISDMLTEIQLVEFIESVKNSD